MLQHKCCICCIYAYAYDAQAATASGGHQHPDLHIFICMPCMYVCLLVQCRIFYQGIVSLYVFSYFLFPMLTGGRASTNHTMTAMPRWLPSACTCCRRYAAITAKQPEQSTPHATNRDGGFQCRKVAAARRSRLKVSGVGVIAGGVQCGCNCTY